MARVVVIVPARYESSRFPGKPLAELLGKPMLHHVYTRAMSAKNVDEVVIATDSPLISAEMQETGFRVEMTSPDHPTGTDRIAEAAECVEGDIILNVQGDEPMINPASIEALVEVFFKDENLDYAQLVKRISDPADFVDNNVVKVALDQSSNILFYSRAPIPYPKVRVEYDAHKHIGVYGFRRNFLQTFTTLKPGRLEKIEGIEQLRAIEHGYRIRGVETEHDTISVDTPGDLEDARRAMMAGG